MMDNRKPMEIKAAELVDGDVIVDKSGTEWKVTGVQIPDREPNAEFRFDDVVAFWIGSPPVHSMVKAWDDTVTVLRDTPAPEWATPKRDDDPVPVEVGDSGDGEAVAERPVEDVALDCDVEENHVHDVVTGEPITEAKAKERLVADKLGGVVLAEESKAHEAARVAATVTGEAMTLPEFEEFTILEARSHLFLLHGVFAEDVKSGADLIDMHAELHATAEKPGRWVRHEHVAGAPFPTEA